VEEGEYGGNITYSRMKMLKLFQEWGMRIKESDGGMNLTMIYCKNFCKCHNAGTGSQ
jgi:hypothetical protein